MGGQKEVHAKLIKKEILTPQIGRYRFQIIDSKKPIQWKPGQYAALGFEGELDEGYSHMREDDPKSLNDDYTRTFTVSSRQDKLPENEFELTIRNVGKVSSFLYRHNLRMHLEVTLQGFGGEFFLEQRAGENISFIAAGVGITPVLPQIQDLDLERFRLYWTVRADDLNLVLNTFEQNPELAKSTHLFITGSIKEKSADLKKIDASGATLQKGRISKADLEDDTAARWYLCAGPGLRGDLLNWLGDKTVSFEDFNY